MKRTSKSEVGQLAGRWIEFRFSCTMRRRVSDNTKHHLILV